MATPGMPKTMPPKTAPQNVVSATCAPASALSSCSTSAATTRARSGLRSSRSTASSRTARRTPEPRSSRATWPWTSAPAGKSARPPSSRTGVSTVAANGAPARVSSAMRSMPSEWVVPMVVFMRATSRAPAGRTPFGAMTTRLATSTTKTSAPTPRGCGRARRRRERTFALGRARRPQRAPTSDCTSRCSTSVGTKAKISGSAGNAITTRSTMSSRAPNAIGTARSTASR